MATDAEEISIPTSPCPVPDTSVSSTLSIKITRKNQDRHWKLRFIYLQCCEYRCAPPRPVSAPPDDPLTETVKHTKSHGVLADIWCRQTGIDVSEKRASASGKATVVGLVRPVTNAREETGGISAIKYETLDSAAIEAVSLTTRIPNESFYPAAQFG